MIKKAMDDNFWVFTLIVFFGAFLLVVYLSSCDGSFHLSDLDKSEMSDGSGDDTPNEIVPGNGGDDLVPGDGTDDGWTPPQEGSEIPGDSDGDGTDDNNDYCQERVFYFCVENHGASAAWVEINGILNFGPNSFHNDCWVKCRVINPMIENNVIDARIAGQPGDWLGFVVKEWDPDSGLFVLPNLLDETIVRSKGQPQTATFNFSINNPETCNPDPEQY